MLTGATGFLGGAIAASLLSRPRWRDVVVLVRARDAAHARHRLCEVMERYRVRDELQRRITPDNVLCGDLCDAERLVDDPRLREISDVINCAAFASFSNHPRIFPTNVEATVRFAAAVSGASRLRRFIQVGTAMCCGTDAPRIVPEDFTPQPHAPQLVPYTASKIEAERRLRKELPELPLVVARPSIIVGHSQLGCRPSPSIFWVFRVARALRRFLCAADSVIDVVPVDYCAEALLFLIDKPSLRHDMYHIAGGRSQSCTFRQIDRAIAHALGEAPTDDYQQVDYEAIEAEKDRFDQLFGPCIEPLVLRAIRLYGAFARLGLIFENQRLFDEGFRPPPRFTSYAGLCAVTSGDSPIASQMQYDFKGSRTERALPHARHHRELREKP